MAGSGVPWPWVSFGEGNLPIYIWMFECHDLNPCISGECRTDFLYCNGMRPQLFQCKDEGKVFKDGRCLATTSSELEERCSRAICRLGEKRTSDKCNEFAFCQKRT